MSVSEGISTYTEADRYAGLEDWPARINAAARAVNAWLREAGLFGHSSNDLVARNAEKELQAAITAWNARGLTVRVSQVNAVVGARVNGALSQVSTPPLTWKEPVTDTLADVAQKAADVAKPAGFGLGFGLVVVGALYVLSVVRPWK